MDGRHKNDYFTGVPPAASRCRFFYVMKKAKYSVIPNEVRDLLNVICMTLKDRGLLNSRITGMKKE